MTVYWLKILKIYTLISSLWMKKIFKFNSHDCLKFSFIDNHFLFNCIEFIKNICISLVNTWLLSNFIIWLFNIMIRATRSQSTDNHKKTQRQRNWQTDRPRGRVDWVVELTGEPTTHPYNQHIPVSHYREYSASNWRHTLFYI